MAKFTDWKTEANGYLVKGMATSVIVVMFILLMMPRFDAKADEDKLDDSSEVSEHFEFEEVAEEEETIEEVDDQQQEDIIDESQEIDMDFDNIDLDVLDTAQKVSTIKSTDELDLSGISMSGIDEESESVPFVMHEEMPTKIKTVKVNFPEIAKKNNVSGTIVLEVWVKQDGSVGNVKVIKSLQDIPGGLDDAAVKAMWEWTFEPAKSGGQPIACWVKIPINLVYEDE